MLWLAFLIPGLIYSIWRLTTRQPACAKCGATDVVPEDSPRGAELLARYHPCATPGDNLPKGNAKRGYVYLALILLIVIVLLTSCSSVQVLDAAAPPVEAGDCAVRVYLTHDQATRNGAIEELCVINGTSAGSFKHTVATAIEKHKRKACACGATDVYLQSQTESGWDVATVTLIAFRYSGAAGR